MKSKFIIANWKMHPASKEQAGFLAQDIEKLLSITDTTEVVVCPPFIYLAQVKNYLNQVRLGAQNVSHFSGGAHTGEISAEQLGSLGVKYAIIGHSERQAGLKESLAEISGKLGRCLENKIVPVVCLGAGLELSDSEEKIKSVIRRQFTEILHGQPVKRALLVYEPTWAISSVSGGRIPDQNHVSLMADFIRGLVTQEHISESAVLYGGSVNSHNAGSYTNIDGFLVGSASLEAQELVNIVEEFTK